MNLHLIAILVKNEISSSHFFGFLFYFLHQHSFRTSCKQIKQFNRRAPSGTYIIKPLRHGLPLVVYCEMAIGGGGFTFLPRYMTTRRDAQSIVNVLFTERQRVLLKLQHRRQRKESYTLIQPHHYYSRYNFGVLVNSYTGYTPPVNRFMRNYILLGIIPKYAAARRTIQGFTSNHRFVQFRNCDANPNSLFAFLPNYYHQRPSTYLANNPVFERQGVAVDWRNSAWAVTNPVRTMPNDFFFLTELHFGGCGCYTSSNRWKNYQGTAIGLR